MNINDLCKESHDRARRKGFYDEPPSIDTQLCRIHCEVSEAAEAYRDDQMETTLSEKGKPEGFAVELADIVIRACDLAEYMGIDLEHEIRQKSDYNESRPTRHGRARV